MFRLLIRYMILMSLVIAIQGCRKEGGEQPSPDPLSVHNALVESNIYLIGQEEQTIDDFLERYGWNMNRSGSGLRYKIDQHGCGPKASYGDRVEIYYSVYLITGDPVYSSEVLGTKAFTVGRGGVESGIEEGILMMREGDKATFILPSHLAHGVPGDGNKIPRRASLVYKVELIKLF